MTTRSKLTTGGWVRIVLYVVASLAGLAAALAPVLGFTDHVAPLMSLSGTLAAIAGGTAIYNVPKADDQHRPDLMEIIRQGGQLVEDLRSVRTAEVPATHAAGDVEADLPRFDRD